VAVGDHLVEELGHLADQGGFFLDFLTVVPTFVLLTGVYRTNTSACINAGRI
jgi:hypothetical protein